jgi:uncharacterized membrane protein YiaA
MNHFNDAISKDLHTQWLDHFHMRDQTWKVVQYSILFFLGVVGLEIKEVDKIFLTVAYVAVLITSAFGVVIALHHRQRQLEKFMIIEIYEKNLGLYELIKPVLEKTKRSPIGRVNTGTYIVAIQTSIFIISFFLLLRIFFL